MVDLAVLDLISGVFTSLNDSMKRTVKISDYAQASAIFKTQLPPSALLQRVSSEGGLSCGVEFSCRVKF